MRTLVLLACTSLPLLAGQPWKNDDLGLEITFPDDWTITEGSGYKEYGIPLLDPGPKIVMMAQAPTGEMELAEGVLQCVQIETCEDTFGSLGSIASTLEENSRDLKFVGVQMPGVKDFKVSETQIGQSACVRCSVLAYKGGAYLNHIFYAIRLANKKVVFVNCYWRDDGMRAFASEFDPIVASVKCSKAVAPVQIVAIGLGIGVALVLLALVAVVAKVRRSAEAPPSPPAFPTPPAPPMQPPPQTP